MCIAEGNRNTTVRIRLRQGKFRPKHNVIGFRPVLYSRKTIVHGDVLCYPENFTRQLLYICYPLLGIWFRYSNHRAHYAFKVESLRTVYLCVYV